MIQLPTVGSSLPVKNGAVPDWLSVVVVVVVVVVSDAVFQSECLYQETLRMASSWWRHLGVRLPGSPTLRRAFADEKKVLDTIEAALAHLR